MDGDGDLDVVSASLNDDKIAWYENLGGSGGSFTTHVITTSADGAYSVFAVDMDGDGDVDVLSASYYGDTVAWYQNLGNGGSFATHVITTSVDYRANRLVDKLAALHAKPSVQARKGQKMVVEIKTAAKSALATLGRVTWAFRRREVLQWKN